MIKIRTRFGSGMDRATVFRIMAMRNSRETGLVQDRSPTATTAAEKITVRQSVIFRVRFFSVSSSTTSRTAHTPLSAAPVTA